MTRLVPRLSVAVLLTLAASCGNKEPASQSIRVYLGQFSSVLELLSSVEEMTGEPFEEDDTVEICHVPPGNPNAAHTMVVGAPALKAHISDRHPGDYLGPCDDEDGENGEDGEDGNELAMSGCAKIEGEEIGATDLSVDINGIAITVDDWVEKEDSSGDYVGFEFTASAEVGVVVKAGREIYIGAGTSWDHPGGTSGPDASGISWVAFCDESVPVCTQNTCRASRCGPAD